MGHFKYVFLGGGQGGGYAAAEFVKQGVKPGELAIVTAEKYVSYERPTLSKGYLKAEGAPRLPGFHACVGGGGEKQTPDWYKEKGIEYLTDSKVESVDIKSKTMKLAKGGDDITYDKLIIATGSTNMTLDMFGAKNAHLKGIHYLRDVADADGLVAYMKEAKKVSKKAVMVGGGYIGLEVSANLVQNGFDVTMVFPEDRLMAKMFNEEMATFYEKYYENKGVTLIKGDTVTGFEGDGKVEVAELKSGKKLEAGLVVVGVGAKPNTDMFKGQIDLLEDKPGGVKVNSQLQTSNPDVYAVGDIAAFPLTMYGGKVNRQEHVVNARLSAAHAVKAIFGSKETYDYLPYFYSREFDLAWQFYGEPEGDYVIHGDLQKGKFGVYWVQDGKVVGTYSESASDEQNAALKQVALKKPDAPSLGELKKMGYDFALKVAHQPNQLQHDSNGDASKTPLCTCFLNQVPAGATAAASGRAVNGRSSLKASVLSWPAHRRSEEVTDAFARLPLRPSPNSSCRQDCEEDAKYYSLVAGNEALMSKIEPASASGAEALAEVVTAALRMQYEPVEDEISLAGVVDMLLWHIWRCIDMYDQGPKLAVHGKVEYLLSHRNYHLQQDLEPVGQPVLSKHFDQRPQSSGELKKSIRCILRALKRPLHTSGTYQKGAARVVHSTMVKKS
ncbi:hypothetical protein WJX77_001023 [Trebouxia sp. C0004]